MIVLILADVNTIASIATSFCLSLLLLTIIAVSIFMHIYIHYGYSYYGMFLFPKS